MRLTSTVDRRPSSLDSFFRHLVFQCFSVSASVVIGQDVSPAPATGSSSPSPVSQPIDSTQFTPGPVTGYPGMMPAPVLAGTSQLAASSPPIDKSTFGVTQ